MGPTWVKVTPAVWVTTTLSVTQVAVNTSVPAMLDRTVKVATPLVLVILLPVVMMALPSPASDTSLPTTGVPEPSFRVTVIVDAVEPSAATEAGEADTVELPASAGGTVWKSTLAVPMVTVSLVAVKVSRPRAADLTVKVASPLASVVSVPAPAGSMVALPTCREATRPRNFSP